MGEGDLNGGYGWLERAAQTGEFRRVLDFCLFLAIITYFKLVGATPPWPKHRTPPAFGPVAPRWFCGVSSVSRPCETCFW